MRTYRYETKISGNGTINIPLNPALYDKEVEVFIVPKQKAAKERTYKASNFVKKWAGFLRESDTDNSKYSYLSDKYK